MVYGSRKLISIAIGLAVLGSVHCGEERAAVEPQRQTNRELYSQAFDPEARIADGEEEKAVVGLWRVWQKHTPVAKNQFLGVPTFQNPLDVWIIQEIIAEVAPDFIVEAGTWHGGSAALWAVILEHVNSESRVITIDIEDQRTRKAKALPIARRKVDFLLGSSTDPAIVAEVRRRVEGKKVLVILDSLHSKEHVAAELAAYSPLVNLGSYVIVQDMLPGVREAVEEFLAEDQRFRVDGERERFRVTVSQGGYLQRVR